MVGPLRGEGKGRTTQKNNFLTLLSTGRFFGPILQSALRGGKTKFFDPQLKGLQGQAFSGMGCLKIFTVKSKKNKGGRGVGRGRTIVQHIDD